VSWKPFVKSKNNASAMTSATIKVISTCCPICRVDVQQFLSPACLAQHNSPVVHVKCVVEVAEPA
jgi:hypothetical protein